MPTVILIGGIARVGKTTLVNRLLKKLPYYTLSTDHLKTMGQKLNEFAKCNKYRSEKLKELAKEHNFMVYDIVDFDSKTEMQDAIENHIIG